MPSSTSPGSVPDLNNWNTYKTEEAHLWKSGLPLDLPAHRLLDLQRTVLEAGERHEVLRILDAPRWDYRRDRDGPVLPWLERHGERIEPLDPYPAVSSSATRGATPPRAGWPTAIGVASPRAGSPP